MADDYGCAIYNAVNKPLTIINCQFNNNEADDYNDGAIYSSGNIYVQNSAFTSNIADENGGAVYCEKNAYADNCTFKNNLAGNDDGAIYSINLYINTNQSARPHNSFFINNKAEDNEGGALYGCYIYLKNSVFKQNYAHNDGGAIFAQNVVNADGCLFESNEAEYVDGGAINILVFTKISSTISNSIFKSNSAKNEGGAINTQDILFVDNCTFDDNHVGFSGGAIAAHSIYINVNQNNTEDFNTFFRGNIASNNKWGDNDGGAIYVGHGAKILNTYFK